MNSSTKTITKVILYIILIILIISSITAIIGGYAGSKIGNIVDENIESRMDMKKPISFNPFKTMGSISYVIAVILLVIAFLTYYYGIRKL